MASVQDKVEPDPAKLVGKLEEHFINYVFTV
jgi:hypothetical protein